MANEAQLKLAREFCAQRMEKLGAPNTAEQYRAGANDDKGDMPLAVDLVEYLASRGLLKASDS
jgi:hypothetical protein